MKSGHHTLAQGGANFFPPGGSVRKSLLLHMKACRAPRVNPIASSSIGRERGRVGPTGGITVPNHKTSAAGATPDPSRHRLRSDETTAPRSERFRQSLVGASRGVTAEQTDGEIDTRSSCRRSGHRWRHTHLADQPHLLEEVQHHEALLVCCSRLGQWPAHHLCRQPRKKGSIGGVIQGRPGHRGSKDRAHHPARPLLAGHLSREICRRQRGPSPRERCRSSPQPRFQKLPSAARASIQPRDTSPVPWDTRGPQVSCQDLYSGFLEAMPRNESRRMHGTERMITNERVRRVMTLATNGAPVNAHDRLAP